MHAGFCCLRQFRTQAYWSPASGPLFVTNGLLLEAPEPLAQTNPTSPLLAGFELLSRETTTARELCKLKLRYRQDSKGICSLRSGQAVLGMHMSMSYSNSSDFARLICDQVLPQRLHADCAVYYTTRGLPLPSSVTTCRSIHADSRSNATKCWRCVQ